MLQIKIILDAIEALQEHCNFYYFCSEFRELLSYQRKKSNIIEINIP